MVEDGGEGTDGEVVGDVAMEEVTTGPGVGVEAGEASAAGAGLADALALAREALIAAHPDAVAELIGGSTPDELRASVAVARAAYARVAEAVRARSAATSVPAGVVARSTPVDAAALSPAAKIAAALKRG